MKTDSDPLNHPRFENVLNRLGELSSPPPSDGFSDSVMAQIHRETERSRNRFRVVKRTAAAVAGLMLVAGFWWSECRVNNIEQQPLQILMSYQKEDGRWSPQPNSTQSRYDTGVTALALLALIRQDSTVQNPDQREAIHAGMVHLLRQQTVDGSFPDPSPHVPFTRYLACMALQRAAETPDAPEEWRAAAARAVPHLPPAGQMTKLNRQLACPDTFPSRWAVAGGPVTLAAIQLLRP